MLNQKNKYAPDVLDCIANLSNDEVFTSPKLANQMLDMVPQELFTNPRTKFLDPCCKSGVFLREIVKRLDKGLEDIIPDRQARIDHILHKQVFGIAITELTAQLSRRTVYCSKYACAIDEDSDDAIWEDDKKNIHIAHTYSISTFTEQDVNDFCINPIQGNIRFNKKIKHDYSNGDICPLCGSNKDTNSEYSHAYELIHLDNKGLEALKNMKWDLIIGNPPYQLKTAESGQAKPLYNIFIEQAKKLCPRYLAMIIPSRWMIGGIGLTSFREAMCNDKHLKELHDFENAEDCFAGVHIDSGVCYFLLDETYNGETNYTYHSKNGATITHKRTMKTEYSNAVIRDYRLISILDKIKTHNEAKFSSIVSTLSPYKIATDYFNAPEKYNNLDRSETKVDGWYHIYGVKGHKGGAKRTDAYVNPKSIGILDSANKYKIFFSATYSTNAIIPPEPILADPNDICTATFLNIGKFDTATERENCNAYMHTNFFRALLYIRRGTIHVTRDVFELIPLQDFNKIWTDEELYEKYGLTQQEIDFINSLMNSTNKAEKEGE